MDMHYPGGKAKTFHHIVNLIPPHRVYIEPFLGLGSVMKAKRSAEIQYGIDLDMQALEMSGLARYGVRLVQDDGINFLGNFEFEGHEVVYCDPPYYPKSRKRNRVYKYDLDENDHLRFLEVVQKINARIIISGYDNDVYRQHLSEWNLYTYSAKAHDGLREECIWYNYTTPAQLHDYRYLGSNFRERQTIQRRLERMKRRLDELSTHEKSFLLQWLNARVNPNAS